MQEIVKFFFCYFCLFLQLPAMTNLVSKHCHSAYWEGMCGMTPPEGTILCCLWIFTSMHFGNREWRERERNWQTASGQLHTAHLELIFKRPIFIWYKSVQIHHLCLAGSFPEVLCQWRQKVCMSEAFSVSQCLAFTPWSCVLQHGWRCFWVLSICFNFPHQWVTSTLLGDFICLFGQNQGNSFLGNRALLGSLPVTHLKLLMWGSGTF